MHLAPRLSWVTAWVGVNARNYNLNTASCQAVAVRRHCTRGVPSLLCAGPHWLILIAKRRAAGIDVHLPFTRWHDLRAAGHGHRCELHFSRVSSTRAVGRLLPPPWSRVCSTQPALISMLVHEHGRPQLGQDLGKYGDQGGLGTVVDAVAMMPPRGAQAACPCGEIPESISSSRSFTT